MIYPNENISIYRTTQTDNISDTHTVSNIMMSMDQSIGPSHPQQQLLLLPLQRQQSYRDIQTAGLPVNPLEFPTPIIHRAHLHSQQSILDNHNHYQPLPQQQQSRSSSIKSGTGQVHQPNQLDDVSLLCHVTPSNHAYWIKNQIPSIGRNIHLGIVVIRRKYNGHDDDQEDNTMTDWVTTEERVLIKSTLLASNVRSNNSAPLTEAACLQLIGNYHTNILGCIEVLQTDEYLYTIMPYCSGICTLESYLQHRPQAQTQQGYNSARPPIYNNTTRSVRNVPKRIDPTNVTVDVPSSDFTVRTVSSDGTIFTNDDNTSTGTSTMFTVYEHHDSINNTRAITQHESNTRMLFLQFLEALQHLQRKGVCHRNINPTTVLIVESDQVSGVGSFNNLVLTDFTCAVRVPYKDESNVGGIADVSQGSYRLLIKNNDSRSRPTRSPSNSVSGGAIASVGVTSSTNSRNPRVRRYHSTSSSPTNRHHQTSKKVPNATVAALNVPSRKTSQQHRHRSPFIAPELIEGQPYDGYTVDLWSVGVMLYVMLVGSLPFHVPNITTDVQYRQINLGQLKQMIRQQRTLNGAQQQQYVISDEVIDLLQNMLWHDPRKRLTLHDILVHPWIISNHTLLQQQYKIKT